MSKLFRESGDIAEVYRREVERLQDLVGTLSVYTATCQAYWGPLPHELEARLTVYIANQRRKPQGTTAARMVEDVEAIITDYKRQEMPI